MEICYLLAFPDSEETTLQPVEQFKGLKDAPYFQPIDIDLVTVGVETIVIEGYAASITRQRYDDVVQIVECHYDLSDPFAFNVLPDRKKIEDILQSRYIPEPYRQSGLFEEYTILMVNKTKSTPDKWIEKNALAISKFIRSQREVFEKTEMQEILSFACPLLCQRTHTGGLGGRCHYRSQRRLSIRYRPAQDRQLSVVALSHVGYIHRRPAR